MEIQDIIVALINCYECGKEVSDTAATCPHCGAPIRKSYTPEFVDEERQVSPLLFVGIIVLPIIFIWVLFKKGYSVKSRIWGVGYVVLSFWFGGVHLLNLPKLVPPQPDTQQTVQSTDSTQKEDSTIPDINSMDQFTADEIVDAYKANTLAADKQFKGKWVFIAGDVDDINTDIFDDAYITLKSSDSFNEPQLSFKKSEEERLSKLISGQKVRALCIGNGDIVKTPQLKNCILEN